jgi:hypothetical protein
MSSGRGRDPASGELNLPFCCSIRTVFASHRQGQIAQAKEFAPSRFVAVFPTRSVTSLGSHQEAASRPTYGEFRRYQAATLNCFTNANNVQFAKKLT